MLLMLLGLVVYVDSPLMDFDQEQFVLTDIKPASLHEMSVGFHVTAGETLKIRRVQKTCPCEITLNGVALPESVGTEMVVSADERDYFVMRFRAPTFGEFDDYVSIKVVGKDSAREDVVRFGIRGNVMTTAKWEPQEIVFDDASADGKQAVTLTTLEGKPLPIKIGEIDPPILTVTAEPGKMNIALSPNAFELAGVETNGDIGFSYTFEGQSVWSSVPFSVKLSNPCVPDSRVVIFGRVREFSDRLQNVTLDCGDLELKSVLRAPDYLSVRHGKIDDKVIVYLRLTARPPKRFSDEVLLETSLEGRPVRLKIAGQIVSWQSEGGE